MVRWLTRLLVYRVFGSRLLMGLAIARFIRARLARRAGVGTAKRPARSPRGGVQ